MLPELLIVGKFCYLILSGCAVMGGYYLFNHGEKLATSKLGKGLKGLTGEGFQISKKITLNKKAINSHICVIAPTRVGKTTSIFIPNLLQNQIRGSIITLDPKGELYKFTHKYQENIGRKTILYSPLDGTIEYNPLKNCRNDREIINLAQSLLINGSLSYELKTGKSSSGIEWVQMAQSLFTAALMSKRTISDALNLILDNDMEQLDQYFSHAKQSVKTQYNVFKTSLESPKTMSSIKNTLASNLQLFTDNLKINKSDFNPNQLREKETILYISYPEHYSNYLSPLMASFYSQFIEHLIEKEGLPIYFMMDEFCNIGMLSNFQTTISTAASRDINFILCLQSITQLKQIYGQLNALSILNNLKTKIILPGISDIETLKYCSELCGETEITVRENGKDHKIKKTLFTPEEIRTLEDGAELIICNNRLPLLDKQNIYYEQQKYLNKIENP